MDSKERDKWAHKSIALMLVASTRHSPSKMTCRVLQGAVLVTASLKIVSRTIQRIMIAMELQKVSHQILFAEYCLYVQKLCYD